MYTEARFTVISRMCTMCFCFGDQRAGKYLRADKSSCRTDRRYGTTRDRRRTFTHPHGQRRKNILFATQRRGLSDKASETHVPNHLIAVIGGSYGAGS